MSFVSKNLPNQILNFMSILKKKKGFPYCLRAIGKDKNQMEPSLTNEEDAIELSN